jgi:glycosyltransferase
MKISIITTSYNSAGTVEDTIKSVLNQLGTEIEYIIVDGGSTDGTLEIINKYPNSNMNLSGQVKMKVISEPDGGMYEAMNKGIRLATGDIIGILNSDDFYASNEVVKTVVEKFQETNAGCVWGDLLIVDRQDLTKVIRDWKSSPYKGGSFQKGWHPPHPTFFVKKSIYEKYGLFRTDMFTWADYELQLRFLEKEKISSSYIPQTLVKMRDGGSSSKSVWWQLKANFGCYQAFKMNGLRVSPLFIFKKPLFKFTQYW